MAGLEYDAALAPDAERWLETDEQERVAAVQDHHAASKAPHPPVERPRVHAAIHVVVENQLAQGDPPEAARALARLVEGGLDRHAAVHAVARVVGEAMTAALRDGKFDAEAYARALDALGTKP